MQIFILLYIAPYILPSLVLVLLTPFIIMEWVLKFRRRSGQTIPLSKDPLAAALWITTSAEVVFVISVLLYNLGRAGPSDLTKTFLCLAEGLYIWQLREERIRGIKSKDILVAIIVVIAIAGFSLRAQRMHDFGWLPPVGRM